MSEAKAKAYKASETIVLNEPILSVAAGGQQIDRVTLRRPKAKLLEEVEAIEGDYATMARLIAKTSDPALTPSEIGELDGNDFKRMSAMIRGFLESSRETGDSAKSA